MLNFPLLTKIPSRTRRFSSLSPKIQISSTPKLPAMKINADGSATKISYVVGPTSIPLLQDTIGGYWKKQVEKYGKKEFLVVAHQNVRWNWTETDEQINALARGLKKLGFKKGDRLGVWLPNGAEWLVCQLATAKLGLILVNINPGYRVRELKHAINLVGIKGIVLSPTIKLSNYIELINEVVPSLEKGIIKEESLPSLEYVIHTSKDSFKGIHKYNDILIPGKNDELDISVDKHDSVNIQFTSGTTGLPKGATLTHMNILNNGYFSGLGQNLTENDVICIPVPLYHCFGCVLGNLAGLTLGCKIVYPGQTFNPKEVLTSIEKEKVTSIYGVPTMFISQFENLENSNRNLSSLRTGIMAGSLCPITVMKRVISEMNCKDITICYGMTETSPVSFQTNPNDSITHRVETIGTVHDHVQVKVIDAEGNIVPTNVPGELCTKGYSVMKGYWNDEKKTKESIDSDGWMHSGDLAVIDDNGYGRIVGRIKDMIIRGGENVFPKEIEDFLYTHPSVLDVQVVGVPDEKFGEEVCAWIIPKKDKKLTQEDITNFCTGQIAHFKIPKYVRFVSEFPMTVTGKIQKFKLREMFKDPFS